MGSPPEGPSEACVAGPLAALSLNDAVSTPSNSSSYAEAEAAAGRQRGGRPGAAGAAGAPACTGVAPAGDTLAAAAKAKHAKETFGELLPMISLSQLLSAGEDPGAEAEYWSIFADVFEEEVRNQERLGGGVALDLDQRRQILADILVWAEVTQSRYDSDTASFVTEPHDQDPSFRRIGDMLKAAKARRGLCR